MRKVFFIALLWMIHLSYSFASVAKPVRIRQREDALSQRNLIEHSRFYFQNGSCFLKPQTAAVSGPDTVRILALMVEFQPDENNKTTGEGEFDLSTLADPVIDPPPHDASYFQNQLKALSNYYQSVSHDKLIVTGQVFPIVLTLPKEMGEYNPNTSDEATDRGLAELFRDAIQFADSAGVSFSVFNCFVVFHAGVGKDIDLGFDFTPQDIPSTFLDLDYLRTYLADGDPDYAGIPVENGNEPVQEGIVLPETENQDGYEFGLLGIIAQKFAFQIGLPALWNTENGRSGIGRWGLMDQGSGNFSGLIPAEPSAFSKVLMGWEAPVDVLSGDSLKVTCSKASGNRIYRIPINDHEYFLIENRMHDSNGDSIAVGRDSEGDSVVFRSDGVIEVSKPGVIVEVDEYDFGLPGSGILIWHVDENVVLENISTNRINNDPSHRGVDLEEADGAQDIGEVYGYLDGGYGSELGVMHDAWFKDNEYHLLANAAEEVTFTPDTYPDSRSYSGANSHLVVSDFTGIDTVMAFSVRNDLLHEGFPVDFGQDQTPFSPLFGDLNGDQRTELVVVTEEGKIFAWKENGSLVINTKASAAVSGYRVLISGDTIRVRIALLVDLGKEVVCPPILCDLDQDGSDEIYAAVSGGEVMGCKIEAKQMVMTPAFFDLDDEVTVLSCIHGHLLAGTRSGEIVTATYLRSFWPRYSLNDGAITGICQFGSDESGQIVAVTENSGIALLDINGQIVWQNILPEAKISTLASAWLDSDSPSIVVTSETGGGWILDGQGNPIARFGESQDDSGMKHSAIGDVDGDGFMEIVSTANGQIRCFNHNGSPANYFPVPNYHQEIFLSSPVLGDVNGDGEVDILTASSEGEVLAYNANGLAAEEFPVSHGGSKVLSPALLDLDGDGDTELTAVSEKGYLYAWDLGSPCDSETVPWPAECHDPARTGMNPQQLSRPQAHGEWMPGRLVYNYPNPTEGSETTIRYYLEYPARIHIKIFNLAGEFIDEFDGPGIGQTDNEVVWNIADVDSGVYFCQVKAEGSPGEKAVTIKIAVVK
jgi:M6 family metalloprotease-like protein